MKTFKKDRIPQLNFLKAVKKPIPIKCVQIQEPFAVETMEGTMTAKKGDWLVIGVQGEMYAIDQGIFKKTYDILPTKNP